MRKSKAACAGKERDLLTGIVEGTSIVHVQTFAVEGTLEVFKTVVYWSASPEPSSPWGSFHSREGVLENGGVAVSAA